jgi:uncharacterized membrane protein YqjE
MAEVERRRVDVPATVEPPRAEIEQLPTLFGRLGDDVMRLVDTKLSLIKVELKEDASFYARNSAFIAVGAVVQKYGPTSYGLGFLITGVVYLVVGLAVALVAKGKLAKYDPAPTATLEEIRKDKQWLKNEI